MDSRLKKPNYEKRIRWDIDKSMILTKKRFAERLKQLYYQKG